MRPGYLVLLIFCCVAFPILSYFITSSYLDWRGYQEPKNAWKCKWVEPIDPADKRACAAIPDKWNGNQFARCMIELGHSRKCPEDVKP